MEEKIEVRRWSEEIHLKCLLPIKHNTSINNGQEDVV
jgi:hypothetical protein